jgi:3-hydroxyacyl-CoA dehydrogenase/enoyl-CoA hydratase/3-hydroxybutyryl-CoA epimerase
VKQLQEGMLHPERVAGLHFFNPVHKMPLVEVVRTASCSRRAIDVLAGLSVRLGKTPVVVQDAPGFVVNRVLMPYLNEAVLMVVEGMAVQKIDHVMERFGMPMGPLELLDQVGLDVAWHIAKAMAPAFADRFPPNDAFERMVQTGFLGQKSGKGFYVHRKRGTRVNTIAVNLLREGKPRGDLASLPPALQAQQARERMVLGMVNEAAACLGEGTADSPETIDLALVLGTGWAPHRGGPLRYAQDRGLENVIQVLGDLARTVGPRFTPCPELRRIAGTVSG